MSSRDRILARRAQFVAAAVALVGCREPEASAPPGPRPATPEASAALAGPPRDAGSDAAPVDTDHDGVPDERDKCPDVFGTVLKEGCPGPCLSIVPAHDIKITAKIYFAAKSVVLAKESFAILDDVAAVLKQFGEMKVEIQGHADPGEPKGIGEQRAKAVRAALVSRGVDEKRMTVRDLGSSVAVEKGAHERNRRVEFVTLTPPQ